MIDINYQNSNLNVTKLLLLSAGKEAKVFCYLNNDINQVSVPFFFNICDIRNVALPR